MLSDKYEKVKEWTGKSKRDLWIAAIIFLVGMIGFGLGRLSVIWPKPYPLQIEAGEVFPEKAAISIPDSTPCEEDAITQSSMQKGFVASKNGAYYHLPWCPGAKKIKESNKIWFTTREDAEKKGYKPASNCPGLQSP